MLKFDFKNSGIKSLINLDKEIKNMNLASKNSYDDLRASINLPFDKKALNKVKKIVKEKQRLNPEFLIVAGIGGSNLGTIAIQEAILSKQYNLLNPKIKILFADTSDSDLIYNIIKIITPSLKKGKKVILNGVSKSGGTTETIANFQLLSNLIKKYSKNYHKYIVVTTDKNSVFWKFAEDNKFSVLEIPKMVGGRYSVFSPVGLFPLGMLNINLDKLLNGAAVMRDRCLKKNNPAVISASIKYLSKKPINDIFLFSNDLEYVGRWYRQLMGESIGKEFDIKNKKVNIGITPTVSIGSTDLHSMAQLYLGGPYDKITTFVQLENNFHDIKLNNSKSFAKLIKNIQGKSLKDIMNAIFKGTQIAFRKNKRPFITITLKNKSEFSIGQLLQFKMMEMMYLGFLLKVNPFNQPNVESYKIETKRLLK